MSRRSLSRRALIAAIVALPVATLAGCQVSAVSDAASEPSPTPDAKPIAEAPTALPTPSPTATPPPTATATAIPTATATPSPTATATPFVRSIGIVLEVGGKTSSRQIPVDEVKRLASFDATGARVPDAKAIRAIVDAYSKEHEKPAKNASFRWSAGKGKPVVVAAEQVGLDIDEDEMARRLTQAVTFAGPDVFPVPYKLVQPTYTAANPPKIGKTVLGSVAHYYNRAEPSGQNQEIGVRYLEGTIVLPGEVFSNDSQVFRQGINVYRDSVVNAGDRNVLAPGGGLCSLATIGFQAAFMAGMEIVERHPHLYWITSYALTFRGRTYRGLDATTGNMRWRNTTGAPVRVHAWADGKQSHVQIVGTSPGWTVRVASYSDRNFVPAPKTVQVFKDPTRPVGFTEVLRDPHDGRDVTVVREVKKGEKRIRRDTFASHYEALGKQILQGTKK